MDFKNKKITVMGLGLLGRGVNLSKYLLEKGAILTITDLRSKDDLLPSLKKMASFYNKLKKQGKRIHKPKFVLGRHNLSDFKKADYIFKAAGVPLDSIFIKKAKKNKIKVLMDDALFGKKVEAPIVGITGTRGKSTTTSLIYQILKTSDQKIYLGGNVKGMATLPLIEKVTEKDLIVLELSSWQLQGWRDLRMSPHIAVVTNIFHDHMNYYKNNFKEYIKDKLAICEYQDKEDFLVLNKKCVHAKVFAKKAKSKVIWFSVNDVPASWKVKIPGKHNLENIAAAIAVAKTLNIPQKKIKQIVEKFQGEPGRLEFVKEYRGVKYYNDTTSTMPDAAIAALKALGGKGKKNIVLIAGGADKNLDFKELAKVIKRYTKDIILLEGTATLKFKKELSNVNYKSLEIEDSLPKAVKRARELAKKGEIVLFSPGCASFGLFKNEFDRGDKFVKIVSSF